MFVQAVVSLFLSSILISAGSEVCTIHNFSEASAIFKRCTNIVVSNITVPAGVTFRFNLKKGSVVTLEGTINFGFKAWKGPLLEFLGEGITVQGKKGSVINGQGERYWDHMGDKGLTKPQLVNVVVTGGSVFRNLYLRNCPHHCFYIHHSDHLTVSGIDIDVSEGDKNNSIATNTDGFNLGNVTNTILENCKVKNQDDCVAINAGSNIIVRNMDCSGGHGLSLSVAYHPVTNIQFLNSIVRRSANGLHIKTHTDGNRTIIRDITYKNIALQDIKGYGINVQQDYRDGQSTGVPTNNIPVVNLVLANITGTMTGTNSHPVKIVCGRGSCQNWHWSGISIRGNSSSSICNFSPPGFKC